MKHWAVDSRVTRCGWSIPALGVLLMWMAGMAEVVAESDRPFPDALVAFKPYANNPVFVSGGDGAWDEVIRERGWIMRDDDRYCMWYTGHMPEGVMRLGYATSDDGIIWQRHPDNPIHGAHWTEDVQVVKHDGRYYMFAEGLQDVAHLFVSQDGVSWRREGALDIRTRRGDPIEEGPRGTPVGWYENGQWYLFYERSDLGIWLAVSNDMGIWRNVSDDPVLLPGPEKYDSRLIAANQIVRHGDLYYIYYHGKGEEGGNWTVNVAVSPDLVDWEKYEGNPLLPDEWNLSSGIVVPDGEGYRLYTTHGQVDLFVNR